MELIVILFIVVVIYGFFQNEKTSLDKKQTQSSVHNHYTQNNIYIQNNYGSKPEAHTAKVWKRLGYKVNYGESYAYKYYGNEIYTEDQVRKISGSSNGHLSSNQKKVKSLGTALVKKHGSKQKAKSILVNHYGFDEDTAKYGAGFSGYSNW
jgi:hypothetical protein